MSVYTSENVCDEAKGYECLFTNDRGTEQVIVKDSLISDEDVARARAISEFLKGSYASRLIDIQTVYISGLKQNDIIEAKGFNWIVNEIRYDFNPPELIMRIKGVRYE